jgi:tetratricopeptide (TPR) repeat protein
MKKLLILIPVLFLLAAPLSGQSNATLMEAFSASYVAEASGKYTEAIATLEPFYTTESYELNLRLGWLQYLAGDYARSETYYRRAVNLLPYAIEPKLGLAYPLAALGNYDAVISLYEGILQFDPHNTLVHYRLGAIFYDRQDYEQAYFHLEKVVNLYPFDYDAVVLFGWVNLRMNKATKARTLFEKALLILPGSESALAGLAMLD